MTSEVDHQLYPDTKLEDSSLRHSRGIKEDAKRKDTGNSGVTGVTQGHRQCRHSTARMAPLIETMRLSCSVFEI